MYEYMRYFPRKVDVDSANCCRLISVGGRVETILQPVERASSYWGDMHVAVIRLCVWRRIRESLPSPISSYADHSSTYT